jgi:hypothetical protein
MDIRFSSHLVKSLKLVVLSILVAATGWLFSEPNPTRANQSNNQQSTPSAEAKAFNQAQALKELGEKIKGQEDKPAEEVFKNIQSMKGVPAARLLRVMEMGYGRSLGVDCTHCHVPDAWDKEDKPQKQITREMSAMVRAINSEQLKNIKNLKGPNPTVNCTTCHRGKVKPALNLN